MSLNIQTDKFTITQKTGIWYYASRSLIRKYFTTYYDTGHNQYALVQWLRQNNTGKFNTNGYFNLNTEITIPADACSVACIIGQKLFGIATTTGITVVSGRQRDRLPQISINDFNNLFPDPYRGGDPNKAIDLNKIRVIYGAPTHLDLYHAATLVGITLPDDITSTNELNQILTSNRPMSFPNNTIYYPDFNPNNVRHRAVMMHEIDHQYTYQMYDAGKVFEDLINEQRFIGNPYDFITHSGKSLDQIKSFNEIPTWEGQGQYIENYTMARLAPGEPPNNFLLYTDYKIFHP